MATVGVITLFAAGCGAPETSPNAASTAGGPTGEGVSLATVPPPSQPPAGGEVSAGGAATTPDTTAATPDLLEIIDLTPDQVLDTNNATELLMQDCMVERGFSYEPNIVDADRYDVEAVRAAWDRAPDAEEVARFGYGYRAARLETYESAASGEPERSGPKFDALEGTETTIGCGDIATEGVGAPPYLEMLEMANRAVEQAEAAVGDDAAMAPILDAWSACVAPEGYPVDTLDELVGKASAVGFDSPDGLAMAVADFGCRERVGYEVARVASIDRYVDEWLKLNPGFVDDVERTKADYAAAAKAVLAAHGA